MIGRSGERGSGISVLAARHDDDDDDDDELLLFCSSLCFCVVSNRCNLSFFTLFL